MGIIYGDSGGGGVHSFPLKKSVKRLHKNSNQHTPTVSCKKEAKSLTRKSRFILESLGFILKKKK